MSIERIIRRRELHSFIDAARIVSSETQCDPAILLALASAESSCTPGAHGDNDHSLGAFQLHDQGAGAGMSASERHDLLISMRRAADYFMSSGEATNWSLPDMFSAYNQGLAGWQSRGIINQPAVDRYLEWYQLYTTHGLTYIYTAFLPTE